MKKGSEKPNGNLPLMCRITVDGEVKQFSCKMDISLRLWDVKNNRAAVTVSGKLHFPEYDQSFNVQDAKLQLFKESKDSDRLKITINGQNIIDWFKEQFGKLQQTIKPHIKPAPPTQKKGRGV